MSEHIYLRALLKAHDWYYEYADDHRHWTKGQDERQAIIKIIRDIPMKDAHDLVGEFCPAELRANFLLQIQGLRYMN